MLLVLLTIGFASASPTLQCILDPTLPANLSRHSDVQPLCAGYINATAEPYSAVGDGVTDDTDALQAALNDAYAARLAVLLPSGLTFMISRQLQAVQHGKPIAMRKYGYQLVGGRGATPPTLRVRDGAALSAFPTVGAAATISQRSYEQRPLIYFALAAAPGGNDAPCHYSAMLRNVVIDLGNNPGLSGVSMSGAQLCSIEDVAVTGSAFTAGIVGLPGSGGFTANLRVDGGAFAVWQAQFRPNPSVTGLVALNQSVAAVLLQVTRGPLVISGAACH